MRDAHHRAVPEANVLRLHGTRGEEHFRRRAVRILFEEVMFDDPQRIEPELVRHAVFGWHVWWDLVRVAYLIAFGVVLWRIAIRAMTRKLID